MNLHLVKGPPAEQASDLSVLVEPVGERNLRSVFALLSLDEIVCENNQCSVAVSAGGSVTRAKETEAMHVQIVNADVQELGLLRAALLRRVYFQFVATRSPLASREISDIFGKRTRRWPSADSGHLA